MLAVCAIIHASSDKAEGEEDEDYTPWSNAEKDETFHDADEFKTFGNEAPIPPRSPPRLPDPRCR